MISLAKHFLFRASIVDEQSMTAQDDRQDQNDRQLQTQQGLQIQDRQDETVQRRSKTYSIKKIGYISRKRKNFVEVRIPLDDEIINFNWEKISEFEPRQYDRVNLYCEFEHDPTQEDGPTLEVSRMEPFFSKEIVGTISTIEPNENGMIDKKYFFFWDLVSQYQDVNKGDRVRAVYIDCELEDDNKCEYRCISVTKIENPSERVSNNGHNDNVNTNGIEITDEIVIEFNELHQTKEFSMTVKNTSVNHHEVVRSLFIGNKADSQIELVSPSRFDTFLLSPNEVRHYNFKATSKYYGNATEHFVIEFSGPTQQQFDISRFINISVIDRDHLCNTIGTGPNVRNNRSYTHNVSRMCRTEIIPGVPPKRAPNFVKIRLEQWAIPEEMEEFVYSRPKATRTKLNQDLNTNWPFLTEKLCISNYKKVFHTLLYLEECELFHNIRKYDKYSHFTRENEYLALHIENVGESRPSIVIGDYVTVKSLKGDIHEVKHNRVLLKFNDTFHKEYRNESYQIYFGFSRKSLMKQHHGIELVTKNHPSVLFPDEIVPTVKQVDVNLNLDNGELLRGRENEILHWYNASLNSVQKGAVVNILQGVARPLPYIIFGPPGTGKTVTLVETILQLIKQVPLSRILVATPSNSSADLIAERIIESGVLKSDEFLRVVGENQLHRDSVPANILRYCGTIEISLEGTERDGFKVTESGLRKKCNAKYLSELRLLIGTWSTLGTLLQCDYFEDHFTHVIIDESGQCFETQAMIPISFVEKGIGQIILAGDPKQLGPVVYSRYAADRGLSQSYLARLLDRNPYKPDPQTHRYDSRLVTKLVYNYRSLPSLMSVYNELFYSFDLKAMVSDTDSDEAEILRKLRAILPHNGVRDVSQGTIFVGVEGKSEVCSDSPSWLNNDEAQAVLKFFMKLIKTGHNADDIGIITPYSEQVKTIRSLLKKSKLILPKIGSVEEFQGQERKIILLSTVRTLRHQLKYDERYSLGFIRSPQRMNVAISRARALLVVFGSPKLLYRDDNWQFLIDHCIQNKCTVNVEPAKLKRERDDNDD